MQISKKISEDLVTTRFFRLLFRWTVGLPVLISPIC